MSIKTNNFVYRTVLLMISIASLLVVYTAYLLISSHIKHAFEQFKQLNVKTDKNQYMIVEIKESLDEFDMICEE